MGLLSLLGFGESKEKVLDLLAREARIMDLRSPEAFAKGNLPGSVNITIEDLYYAAKDLRKEGKPILVVCGSGLRSDEVAAVLREAGLEAINAGKYRRLKRLKEKM
jgi:rhodanese-related sulfurtransferase